MLEVQGGHVRVVTVASGLLHPWSLAFLPDGKTLLVAETGRLRVIRGDALDPEPAWTLPAGTSPQNNDTMKWIALHPDFAKNKRVYVSYPLSGERGTTLAIGYGTFDGKKLSGSSRSSSPTRGRTAATWPAACCSARTARCTSRSAIAIGCAAQADRRQQPAHEGAGARQPRRQDAASPRRRQRAAGQSVRRPAPARSRRSSPTAIATATAWRSIPRPGELWQAEIGPMGGDEVNILIAGPQLRLAARVDGPQLHGHARVRSAVVARRAWTTRGCSGCRRSARRASCSTRATSSRAGRTACSSARSTGRTFSASRSARPSQAERREAAAASARRSHPRRAAEPRRLHLRRDGAALGGTAADGTVLRIEPVDGF